MALALVFYCLSHPLAPAQTALRQPLGSQIREYPGRPRGSSSHPHLLLEGASCLWWRESQAPPELLSREEEDLLPSEATYIRTVCHRAPEANP